MEDIIFFALLLGIGYFVGSFLEQRHYKDIKKRERQTLHVPLVSFGAKQQGLLIAEGNEANLFVGSVVVSGDYFKMFTSSLRNLVGGRVVAYESILDRGRREAILRMKEGAIAWGATKVVNVRLETARIGNQNGRNGLAAIEVIAYGTGIR
ncbi:YbjQ family protein [Myxosarcina sp. GI1]|uniref:YbjQ family protein n=1 Tax=Myxosarcina sp. GI1 TaxID=1541065 RepID=UPI000564E19C|nr:heavy metal-binding domain-containing protein [Myxosarcina sp. GI1]